MVCSKSDDILAELGYFKERRNPLSAGTTHGNSGKLASVRRLFDGTDIWPFLLLLDEQLTRKEHLEEELSELSAESESTINSLKKQLEAARGEAAAAVKASKADKATLEKFMIEQINAKKLASASKSKSSWGTPRRR